MSFDFSEKYSLENDEVLLRPLEESDFEFLKTFSINEPDTWQYSLISAAGEDNLRKYIETALLQRKNETEYPYIVFDKRSQQYVGCTRFYNISFVHKTLEIGYTWYGRMFQGTAVNKNCKYLLLEFAFEKMNKERVGFRANNLNERSKQAMRSIGCIDEGVQRSLHTNEEGQRIDSAVLSILKTEWMSSVKDMLNRKNEKMKM
jgi:RimJ/RimL family protein N-acetyltransferase